MKLFLAVLASIWLCGCAGGRCRVSAPAVTQPVSCTAWVFDGDGKLRQAGTNDLVQHFSLKKQSWSMLWTGLPLNSRQWDISQSLESKLQDSSGNAIVNVTVTATGCNFLHWYLAALVPVLPSYANITVEGDVARIPPLPADE